MTCLINVFSCPICNNKHKTASNYSRVVCNNCISIFGTTDQHGKKLEIVIEDSPFFTKVEEHYSKNKECYINKRECYIIVSDDFNNYEIVSTIPIPKFKGILRNGIKDSISYREFIQLSINNSKKSKSFSFN